MCRDVGCGSDQECINALGEPDLVCAKFADHLLKIFVRRCSVAADCVTLGAPPTRDEDRFVCTNNLCKHTGCNADLECNATGDPIPLVCR